MTETRLRRDQLDRAHRAHRHRASCRVRRPAGVAAAPRQGRLLNHCITRPDDDSAPIQQARLHRPLRLPRRRAARRRPAGRRCSSGPGSSCGTRRTCASTTPGRCAAWCDNLDAHWDEAVAEVGLGTARVWALYLAGSRLGFERNQIQLHQCWLSSPTRTAGPACRCGRTGASERPVSRRQGPSRAGAAAAVRPASGRRCAHQAGVPPPAPGVRRGGAAARGTSRRCRAGAATAAPSGPSPRSGTPGSSGRASTCSSSGWRRSTSPTGTTRLGEVRRAGDVGEHAAGAQQLDAAPSSSSPCSLVEAGQVGGLPAPARLGPPPQRTEPAARRVEQHAVDAARSQRRRAGVGGDDASGRRCGARAGRGGAAPRAPPARAALGGQHVEQRGLAAGAGAQVDPDAVGAVERGGRERDGDQLAALVLHAGGARLHGGERAGVALGEAHGVRRPRARACRRWPSTQLARGGSRRATRCTSGRASSAASARAGLPQVAAERVAERARDPLSGGCARAPARRARSSVGASSATQVGEVLRRDLAQHGVDEADRPGADDARGRGRRSPRRRRAAGCGCAAAGGRRGAARRAPAGRPWPAAGRRTPAITASYRPWPRRAPYASSVASAASRPVMPRSRSSPGSTRLA